MHVYTKENTGHNK